MRWLRAFQIIFTALRFGVFSTQARGVRLRLALQGLGPIFIKFGQVLSTRPDLIPVDIAEELTQLQEQVPPFSGREVVRIIERAYKKPIADVFVQFDPVPVASASVAQVHFGQIHNRQGQLQDVAIKVLRPGLARVIDKDIALMRWMAKWVERLSKDGKRLKPTEVVAEFDKNLHDELDLMREAANASQLKRNMQGMDKVIVPEMLWDFCLPEVLVMQRMDGVPLHQYAQLQAAGVDLKQLAADGQRIFFAQVFRDGFFHADMHPGNIRVSIEPATLGHYILLDFGIMGTLTENDKNYLLQNFSAFFKRDYKRVAQLHIDSGWAPAHTRVDELEAAVRAVCEPYFDRPLKEISLGMILLRLFQTSRRFEVEIQPQLVLLQKTLLNVESFARALDPDMDLWATVKPLMERWMREQFGPMRLLRDLSDEAPRIAQWLPKLPLLLERTVKNAESADARSDVKALTEALQELHQSNRQLRMVLFILIGFVFGLTIVQLWWRFG